MFNRFLKNCGTFSSFHGTETFYEKAGLSRRMWDSRHVGTMSDTLLEKGNHRVKLN